jgi:hypothetical protein
MMRIPSYIQRSRHGIYFFRIVVPKALRETVNGRWEIKHSLQTRDLREALRVARPLALQAFELFERLGGGMSKTTPSIQDILAKAQSGQLRDLRATKTITLPDGTKHTYDVQTDSSDPAEIAAFERQVEQERAELRAAEERYRAQAPTSEAMLAYQRKDQEEMEAFKRQLEAERAERAAAKAAPKADEQDEPPLKFTPDPENTASRRWAEYVTLTGGVNWTANRTVVANGKKFQEFLDWWGRDEDIRAIDRNLYNKFLIYLTTKKVVNAGKKSERKGADARYADNYTSVINTFLQWAQNKGYFPDDRRLPTDGQTLVSKKARVARSAKANPEYMPHQLQRLFDPKQYQFKLAHHFWPPLIALFTGGRRREIAQLLVHDFRVIDGIPAISIDDLGDEDKEIKSAASKRIIPVHPELISLGLLDYVEDVKALNLGDELFPGIGVNGHGEKGNAVGQAWRRHKAAVGMEGDSDPTYHSFRATAIGVLKANGVPFDMRCQLVGHELNHVSQSYDRNPYTVKQLMEQGIPKLVYEGLVLSGLAYKRHQFDQSNIKEAAKTKKREAQVKKRAKAKAEKNASKLELGGGAES